MEDYNADELHAPEWLNDEFFTKVLRSCERDETIKLKKLMLSPAAVRGDHYASIMFRANVDYETALNQDVQSMSMIIKTMPEMDGEKKEMFSDSFIFETEIGMYTEVIPKFESILKAAGDDTALGARCLFHSLSPKKVIIFEDLALLGYTVVRDRELNIEEVKAALLKLAKWHAVSYKIIRENPNFFEKYRHGIMANSQLLSNDWMTGGIRNFLEMLDSQPKLLKYKPYFEAMKSDLLAKSMATCTEYRDQPHADALYVLNHGDFHYKNMLFRHDVESGHLQDVMLVDFQMCYVGPMVADVIYVFVMVMNRDMRSNHKDELIYYFFSNFVDTLQRIEYEGKIPKMLEFRQMWKQHIHWELFLMVTFLPIWQGFRGADMTEYLHNLDARKRSYFFKDYINEMEECLPKYLYKGYLDSYLLLN